MSNQQNNDCYLPREATIISRTQESATIFTLRLQFTDFLGHEKFIFQPGQFNMVYLYGVGEVAISIVSDPQNDLYFEHTIRIVGRVTKALAQLKKGDSIGIRGPFGRGWPMDEVCHKDIVIVTGGLGCAPTVSVINYMMNRRDQYGALKIFQGVKHSNDLIFGDLYQQWQKIPNTEIVIAADKSDASWPWHTGRLIELFQQLKINTANTIAMMCGPEAMMAVAVKNLIEKNIPEESIFLSMERNMECAVGHCGHCQYGGLFICKNGPVFAYSQLKELFGKPGF